MGPFSHSQEDRLLQVLWQVSLYQCQKEEEEENVGNQEESNPDSLSTVHCSLMGWSQLFILSQVHSLSSVNIMPWLSCLPLTFHPSFFLPCFFCFILLLNSFCVFLKCFMGSTFHSYFH